MIRNGILRRGGRRCRGFLQYSSAGWNKSKREMRENEEEREREREKKKLLVV